MTVLGPEQLPSLGADEPAPGIEDGVGRSVRLRKKSRVGASMKYT